MDELINKQETVDLLMERASNLRGTYGDLGGACSGAAKLVMQMRPAQPKRETTTLRIGRTRNSVTMWYECAECGEPVDQEDAFCRRCGRGIIHE